MENFYATPFVVGPCVCDVSGRLGYPGAFSVFQDLATAHAPLLGVGFYDLSPRSLYWLTVRTKIVFRERPGIEEHVTLRTWAEKPGAARCSRSYEIARGEEILVCGKTEWAVINTDTHSIVPMEEVFPKLEFDRPTACPAPYARVPDRFRDCEPFAEYRVRSTDIDVGGHMNNAAYLRALFGAFSNAELNAMEIHEIDAGFRASCFEGETLQFYKKESGGALEVRIARGEETVLLARIV